jgi:hypothetical protein
MLMKIVCDQYSLPAAFMCVSVFVHGEFKMRVHVRECACIICFLF